MSDDDLLAQVTMLVRNALGLDPQIPLDRASQLLGAMPEVDSMALVSILTALEQHFEIHIDDDEVDATLFASVGSLVDFVAVKTAH